MTTVSHGFHAPVDLDDRSTAASLDDGMSSVTAPLKSTDRSGRRVTGLLVAGDALGLTLGVALAGTGGLIDGIYAVGALLALALGREYRNRLVFRMLEEAPRLVGRLLLPLLVLGAVSLVLDVPPSILRLTSVSVVAVLVGRAVSYTVIRGLRRRGHLTRTTVILGAGSVGAELVRNLMAHPEYGLRPIGIIDDVPADDSTAMVGRVDELRAVLAAHSVSHLIVAFGPTRTQELVRVVRSAILDDIQVHLVPRFYEVGLAPTGCDAETVWGIPLYRVRQSAIRASAFHAKRVTDIAIAGSALLLAAPLMAALAVAVRLSSPGPILFRQQRVGQHGRIIEILKFRTLRVNEDADVKWSVADDDRRTWIGHWLRRLSLDELPQLWNVVNGDMSLVGPRPERPHFVDQFGASVDGYHDRHRLPVGVTGLAQVHGLRGDTSISERCRFDNFYIEHWSPWQDLVIAIRTVGAVLRTASENAEGAVPERTKRKDHEPSR